METPRNQKAKPRRLTDYEFVALVEDRWSLMRADRAWQRAEIAVGLRFDVFNRDGFRCRYCGRGPGDGVFLEADHVLARANGGSDTLDNLVTACGDCNRGKSAKLLTA
jgi:5-methylcytosine-specific restriction endonuclease McrA